MDSNQPDPEDIIALKESSTEHRLTLPIFMYYGYKATRPTVSDVRVREAMNIAINRAVPVS